MFDPHYMLKSIFWALILYMMGYCSLPAAAGTVHEAPINLFTKGSFLFMLLVSNTICAGLNRQFLMLNFTHR